ncbi:hypothetical protein AVEN_117034-1, partial [Araneus ventricosus]
PLRQVRFGEWHSDRVLTRLWNHNRFAIKELCKTRILLWGKHLVKYPLGEHYISLPLAIVDISLEFGKVPTKAAVFADSFDQGRFILGNRKAALIEKKKMGKFTAIKPINTVQTRSETREVEKEMTEKESDSPEIIVVKNGINKTENAFELESHSEEIKIPDLINESRELTLQEINRENLRGLNKTVQNWRNFSE